jgi:hypothetical protein
VLRARLNGGIRNKAARGELRRALPIGLIWGEADGEVLLHRTKRSAARFGRSSSVSPTWAPHGGCGCGFVNRGCAFRCNRAHCPKCARVLPVIPRSMKYSLIRSMRVLMSMAKLVVRVMSMRLDGRMRHLPRSEWSVVIHDHHYGFIDWTTFEVNQSRLAQNTHPRPHQAGGVVREGAALLQGIAKCGRCGRGLRIYYRRRNSAPGYYCAGNTISNGRGEWCVQVTGLQVDHAVAETFLAELRQPVSRLHSRLPSNWNPTMTVCSHSSDAQWNGRSMKYSGPSAAIVRSILKTGWWPVAWRQGGPWPGGRVGK